MSATPLERWYRRLLRSYPRSFRVEHGDELLTVLLACAPVGQRYPRPSEVLDLVRHGLRARARARMLRRHDVVHPAIGGALPSSAPLPKSYGQALRTIWWAGFRPTVDDWSWRRWNTTWVRAFVTVIAVAGGVLLAASGYRHFFQYDPFTRSRTDPHAAAVQVGHTLWVSPGLVLDSHVSTLSITSVTPRMLANTAHATVVVERCRGPYLIGGRDSWDAPGVCNSLTRFRPHSIGASYIRMPVHVVLAVTPHRPGVVEIGGVSIDVHSGWRRGSENAGIDWTVTSHR